MKRLLLGVVCGLLAGCGGATGTGPDPIPTPTAVAVPGAAEPVPAAVSETPTDGLGRSPVNLWGAKGYKWPDGTWTPWIPTVNPWK